MARGLLRAVWAVTALAIAGAAILAIVTVIEGDFGDTDGRTVFALAAVFLCGGAAISALQLVDGRLPLLGALLLIASAVELVLFQLGIWKAEVDPTNDYAKLVPIMLAWVIATIVLATLPLVAVERRIALVAVPVGGGSALVGATIATVMIWRESDSEAWGKTLAVVAILMVAGYLMTAVARRVLPRPRA
jgi:hypothetical protein